MIKSCTKNPFPMLEELSRLIGRERISWRRDPVFVTDSYSVERHIEQFRQMAKVLSGYTEQCVVSFIDLYEKTRRNFKGARSVTAGELDIFDLL